MHNNACYSSDILHPLRLNNSLMLVYSDPREKQRYIRKKKTDGSKTTFPF